MGCSFVIGQKSNLISGTILVLIIPMKYHKFLTVFMFVGMCVYASSSFAQPDSFELVGKIIKTGNAKDLVKQFNSTVELNIDGQEESYSKSQAEAVLRNFFTKNPPTAFAINHKGSSKSGLPYAIGEYKNNLGVYRVWIRLKTVNGKNLVYEMSFVKE